MDQTNSPRPGDPGLRDSYRLSRDLEQALRVIMREEIAKAFAALAREADHLDAPYETAELDSRALSNIVQAARGAAGRVVCPHERTHTWGPVEQCAACGEPIEQVNPFEEDGRG